MHRRGTQVFVSGTTAHGHHLDGDAHSQAKAALATVSEALVLAGVELCRVVRTVICLVDMADAPLVARAHWRSFGQVRPASTLVQVAALTLATARVEVGVTAVAAD